MTDTQSAPPAGNSFMDALRKQHDKLVKSSTIDIPLPGYDYTLVARYRVLSFQDEIAKIGSRIEREFKDPALQALYGSIDSMVLACVELGTGGINDEFQTLESIIPTEAPVRFGPSLAESMGWEGLDGARDVVLKLFDNNEPMILTHVAQLNRWMSNTTGDANATFMGNL